MTHSHIVASGREEESSPVRHIALERLKVQRRVGQAVLYTVFGGQK